MSKVKMIWTSQVIGVRGRRLNKQNKLPGRKSIALAETRIALRVINTLEKAGILTTDQLAKKTAEELKAIAQVSDKTIQQCSDVLDRLQISHRLKDRFSI
jgi:DNA-directed RNA polymerase alpha subunit